MIFPLAFSPNRRPKKQTLTFNKVQSAIAGSLTREQLELAWRYAELHLGHLKGNHLRDVTTVYWDLYEWRNNGFLKENEYDQ